VPVINAETVQMNIRLRLLDLYTIWKEFGKIDGLTIGMIGDLKNSRVQHSQFGLLKHFKVKFVLVSPKGLEMPSAILKEMAGDLRRHGALASGSAAKVVATPEEMVKEVDVISVSRIQKERFVSDREYKKFVGVFVVDAALMKKAKKHAIVLQPLPRVEDIAVEVDTDPRARYFHQVGNGVAIRMALLKKSD
jgi:aspartate carbamoyltransferase catalytic subunit